MFQAEKTGLVSVTKEKGKTSDRNHASFSKEKKTSLKRRGEPEPPNYLGMF